VTDRNRFACRTLACLCALLLTGCATSNREASRPAPPAQTTAASNPTAIEATTTSVPVAEPAERPTAATGLTLAAGESFIRYYIDLLNYSYMTGNSEYLLDASDKGCIGCKGIGDFATMSNGRNGGLSGDYKDHLVTVKEIFRGKSGRVGGSAQIRTGAYRERPSPSATPIPRSAATATMEFTLAASGGNWIMYELQIKE
jgi:hypothetical protein